MNSIYDMPRLNLRDILRQSTIAELRTRFEQMGLKVKSNIKKDLMVNSLSSWVLNNPEIVINYMLTYELRIYDELINNPENGLFLSPDLNRWPFDNVGVNGDDIVSYIAPDLAEKLNPLLADAIAKRKESGEETVENHIVGLLNLRGFLTDVEFDNILRSKCKDLAMHNAIHARFTRFEAGNDLDDDIIIESPYIYGTNFNAFDEKCVDSQTEPKNFSKEEIAKAAMMPYPHIGGKDYDKLKAKLISFGKPEQEANTYLLERWLNKQNDSGNLLNESDSYYYDSFEQMQKVLPLLTNYVNRVPFWKFKGWSSEEIAARGPRLRPGQMPHITIGPNLRARGINSFEQLQEMASRGESIPDMPIQSGKKVARNAPCPCGSGKKYKHCCGK